MAIQLKAQTMNPLKNIGQYVVRLDESRNPVSVEVTSDEDHNRLMVLLEAEHKRKLELLKLQHTTVTTTKQGQGQKLEILVNDYLATLNKKAKNTLDTLGKYRRTLEALVEYAKSVGVEYISELDRRFVIKYLEHLREKSKKSDKTIQGYFYTLSTFYNRLLTIGETKEANPFVGHDLEYNTEPREPFTDEELVKIFTNPQIVKSKTLFYILMLQLTTGARPNEICQLYTDNIHTNPSGFYTISIEENKARGQSVKTKQSNREVPLHPLLLENGFLEFLESRPKTGMLFDLNKPTDKNYSTFISADFSKLLREMGIPVKTMYCFRHTVTNHLKQCGVEVQVREDLQGHTPVGFNEKVYSKKYSPDILKAKTEEYLYWRHLDIF
jgi:site-specific recombinase XerD